MKRVLQTVALLAAFTLPAFCQYARLSNHDQHEFDEAYNKWIKDTRKNDRDDISKDVRKMQSIMEHNNIPPDVPFDRIATNGRNDRDRYDRDRDRDDRDRYNDQGRHDNRGYGYPQNGGARLSPNDQREFDRAYSKWVDDSRRNDRDDIQKDERRMQDIMAHYNIPQDVPYDQIASPDNGYRH